MRRAVKGDAEYLPLPESCPGYASMAKGVPGCP